MGNGLKRVAKQCGGISVSSNGKTVEYDENGKMKMEIVKMITTKKKRFSLTTHNGFSGKQSSNEFNTWKNNYLLEMANLLVKYLDDGYTEVPNGNGGDDDYLCFDHLKKEFIWCENGFAPFQKTDLERYENDSNITLEYLYSIRN